MNASINTVAMNNLNLDAAADFFGGKDDPDARSVVVQLLGPVVSDTRPAPEPPGRISSLVSAVQVDVVGAVVASGWSLGMAFSVIAGL